MLTVQTRLGSQEAMCALLNNCIFRLHLTSIEGRHVPSASGWHSLAFVLLSMIRIRHEAIDQTHIGRTPQNKQASFTSVEWGRQFNGWWAPEAAGTSLHACRPIGIYFKRTKNNNQGSLRDHVPSACPVVTRVREISQIHPCCLGTCVLGGEMVTAPVISA